MLYLSVLYLALLINPNLSIINIKIAKIENIIKPGNLTSSELIYMKDELNFLIMNRYRIILQEELA
tara:strand:+ start:7102 stop:7299 length:198 start_codon:yes stop_codon:yes gene_type:complete